VIEGWRRELLELRARAEAVVDFADEAGVSEAAQKEIGARLQGLIEKVDAAVKSAARGEAIREGIRVVIAGPPNAGKSSLLNVLAGREAAIVSSLPGTTRDVIEVSLDMGGLPVVFSDTAGLHDETHDEIERIGMARARRALGMADIVVWLTEPGSQSPPPDMIDSSPLWVENKCDLAKTESRLLRNDPHYRISVLSGEGMTAFLDGLRSRIVEEFDASEPAMIVRARQRECLDVALERLKSAENQHFSAIELLAEDLRAAADAIGRLTGKINVEEVLGEIFAEFCIGK
jgi:tRNA modification GTPase